MEEEREEEDEAVVEEGEEEGGRIMSDKIKDKNSLEGPPPVEKKFSVIKDKEGRRITPCPVPTHSDVF